MTQDSKVKMGTKRRSGIDEAMLDLESDKIFEVKTIGEVKDLIRGLQHETDRKREELRSLVGERYRDLMEAAETIIEMRQTSTKVLDSIQQTHESMSSLNTQLGHFKRRLDSVTDANEENQYALAAQIKLLMDIPERLWSSIDDRDFILATKLYLFSRHIHTNLSLNEAIMISYPVIDRQWAGISQFQDIISKGINDTLQKSRSSLQDSLNCMVAMILLKNKTQKQVFDDFLSTRKSEIVNALKKHEVSAKSQINFSLAAIASLIYTVHEAFVQDRLTVMIKEASEEKTVELLHAKAESPVMDFLPGIIRDFKPSSLEKEALEHTYITDKCKQWLDEVHGILAKETSVILSHVHNVTGLANIRKSVYTFMNSDSSIEVPKWNKISESLFGKIINLWEEFYRHQFRDRIEAIINTHFNKSVDFIQSSLKELANEEDTDDEKVIDFMISEVNTESLIKLKAKAYSPHVQAVCSQYDSILDAIVKDVSDYLDETNDNAEDQPFLLDSDNDFVLKNVQDAAIKSVQDCTEYIEKGAERLPYISSGRLLQAIPDLCKALKTCTAAPKILGPKLDFISSNKVEPEWQNIKEKLVKTSNLMFNLWVTKVVQDFDKDFKDQWSSASSGFDAGVMLKWDTIEISEQAEDGTEVKSKIKVPQNLSLPTWQSLMQFCQKAYKIGAHSLPNIIHQGLSSKAVNAAVKVIQDLAKDKLTQNFALQFYFDIQFLSLISPEDCVQEALEALENHIDPFDLSVFSPYIVNHAKRTLLRHQSLISMIIPSDRFSLMASMKSSIPLTTSDQVDHNVMHMTSTPRLTLLPVMKRDSRPKAKTLTASNLPQQNHHFHRENNVNKAKERKRSKSPAQKAANFFEAMSNSWFGGK